MTKTSSDATCGLPAAVWRNLSRRIRERCRRRRNEAVLRRLDDQMGRAFYRNEHSQQLTEHVRAINSQPIDGESAVVNLHNGIREAMATGDDITIGFAHFYVEFIPDLLGRDAGELGFFRWTHESVCCSFSLLAEVYQD